MNLLWSESFSKQLSTTLDQDILIKSILFTHEPDGRDFDSEMLLRLVEFIMNHATPSQASVQQQDSFHQFHECSIEVEGSKEPLGSLIYTTSCEILCKCYEEENADTTALGVLNLLKSYRWETKLLLVLSAFAMMYGEFWIVTQSHEQNSLAASIALLRHFPSDFNIFKPIFTALASLIKTIVNVVRCVMQFENLPFAYLEQPNVFVTSTKSLVYAAAYWVVRSIMMCISLVTNLGAIKDEQDPNLILITVWEITSLKNKISSIGNQLRMQADVCKRQTEKNMHKRLMKLCQEIHLDNQEVLQMLFPLKNDLPLENHLPLKQSSEQHKLGISSLENKVVILLMSTIEQLPIEELLFLVHQTNDHPLHSELDGREMELWEEEQWNLKLLLDINDPLLTRSVEEGRTICIYGSKKLDWLRKFSAEIKDIQCLVSQLKVVYVGSKNQSELTCNIVSVIDREKLSHSLSLTKMYFFWCRLESMRRSRLNLGQTAHADHILRGVESLLATSEEDNNDEDWMIIGTGSSTNMIKLQAIEWSKFLDQYPKWKKYLPKIGLVDTIRLSLEPPATELCLHSKVVRYSEGLIEEKICEKCKRPVEKFIMYDALK